ncbi:MAG TPA: molybdopterin-dependent oxidoreductase [Thermomicrobiales bacterium]|jgi:DMSO/TMAO reductase YedYZ molybdopterin-dependent catalytic subunit|nr:molybdopterin-dependent oxidoreductase [Thermomicrobiales bacterium]
MTRNANGFPRLVIAALLLFVCVGASAPRPASGVAQSAASPAVSPAAAGAVDVTGLVVRSGPVTIADFQRLPSETVVVTYQAAGNSESHTFTGVRLWDALQEVGLATARDEKNPTLTRYLVVTANDGYQVVLSVGEIDPNFGHAPILLAWAQDGQPLAGADGPLRLVAPGDVKGGRYVHGIVRIDVRSVGSAAG